MTPDVYDKATRSRVMRAVKSKNTTPEKLVRSLLHAMGLRFRLHRKDLPGTPDIVLPKWKTVLFVHGCFWHGHDCPRGARMPKTNAQYWSAKIERNRRRHEQVARQLKEQGWQVLVVWECQTKCQESLAQLLRQVLPA